MRKILVIVACLFSFSIFAQVTISIDFGQLSTPISPNIYGRNNSLSGSPSKPVSAATWQLYKDAGVRFMRENGGNNLTKYNWKKKIGSHPDWYNNVFANDWDFAVTSLKNNLPDVKGMWGFQLLGKVASNNNNNFNDWAYNQSNWWAGVNQNLAGGGQPNTQGGSKATTEGNPDLYLQDWPADSTVSILDHWLSPKDLNINKNQVQYWNMDNESDIWSSTHDDVLKTPITAEEYMQKYFVVAKRARAKYNDIKLVGPVIANEWQWYNWNNSTVSYGGVKYPFLEYFIKRIGEEQTATGIRLLDVLDLHFYPNSNKPEEIVQNHRVYFDSTYNFPEANGVKTVKGGWDPSQTKEYIFSRSLDWMTKYIGPDHGVKLGVSETGVQTKNPNVLAVWYASTMGEFMKHTEMDLFCPWYWENGMWETLHLFSRYNKSSFVNAVSSDEVNVSAYPSINQNKDSATIVLVNRSTTTAKNLIVNLSNFDAEGTEITILKFANLPTTETFISHNENALVKSISKVESNVITVSMEPLSVYSLLVNKVSTTAGFGNLNEEVQLVSKLTPNPISEGMPVIITSNKAGIALIEITDVNGKTYKGFSGNVSEGQSLVISTFGLKAGLYFVKSIVGEKFQTEKLVIK